MKRKTKKQIFDETGEETCRIHGKHKDWIYFKKSYALVCKLCSKNSVYSFNKRTINEKEYVLKRIIYHTRTRAKSIGVKFDLSLEWLINKIEEQNNRCFYSGIMFNYGGEFVGRMRIYLPSIDQIVPGTGYTKENCVIVISGINIMKGELPVTVFKELCSFVSDKNKLNQSIQFQDIIRTQ